ncbi:palmitoyltransferase ZDHHC18-like isoform X1 [Clarias magur]|uniref:Palmitoyltransferase n=1 Tax=Clarias magur TaxID=1594786 RepID=A0A8J4XFU2_CLAMG|nr:palmitoyltransferase ZDHHC18-like isoform X1 [Clarias magur]
MKNCEYQQIDPRALGTPASTPASTLPLQRKELPQPRRKWEVFPGKNRFYCNGRIIVSRQCGVLPLTLSLIVLTTTLFFIFDCPFLVAHLTICIPVIAGVLFLFVIITLLRTSFTDPGILPRAFPEEAADIERQIDNCGSATYRPPPRTKEILINGQLVKLKYCFTCKMFRPPRTSHCSLCDNCVERFDHHCPWVGNCVGKRNYRFFYTFIISLSFLTSFIFGCVITHLTLRSQDGKGFVQALRESPARYPFCLSASFWDMLDLHIKGSWSSKRGVEELGNPYSYNSIYTNCCVVLCGPMPPSLIDRRGFLPPDVIPQTVTSETELHPFMTKHDTNMYKQAAKELLESVFQCSVIKGSCSSATPMTTPVTEENLPTTVSSTPKPPSGRLSTNFFGRSEHHLMDKTCPQKPSKKAQALSFHLSVYSVSHRPLILRDVSDMGILSLT